MDVQDNMSGQPGQNAESALIDRMLIVSTGITLLCSVLGITFFFLTNSEAILLDGMFNVVSFAVALLSCKISRMARIPWTPAFHFGFSALEPFFVMLRGGFMLAVGAVALVGNVQNLMSDEIRQINPLPAFCYAVVCVVLCFIVWLQMRVGATKTNSPILQAEAQNWLINGLISVAVGVAFLLAYLLGSYEFMKKLQPHLDSCLVVVVVLITLPVPVSIIKNGVLGLLGSAPEKGLQHNILQAVNRVLPDAGLSRASVLQIKPGKMLTVVIFAIPQEEVMQQPIASIDARREIMEKAVTEIYPDSVVEVIFTTLEHRLPGGHQLCASKSTID